MCDDKQVHVRRPGAAGRRRRGTVRVRGPDEKSGHPIGIKSIGHLKKDQKPIV